MTTFATFLCLLAIALKTSGNGTQSRAHLRKCCLKNNVILINDSNTLCIPITNQPPVIHPLLKNGNFHLIFNRPCDRETEYSLHFSMESNELNAIENGSVHIFIGNSKLVVDSQEYCLDHINGEPGILVCAKKDSVNEYESEHVLGGRSTVTFTFVENGTSCDSKCVRKCCPRNLILQGRTCTYSNRTKFAPKVYWGNVVSTRNIHFNVHSANSCSTQERRFVTDRFNENIYLQESGYLLRDIKNRKRRYVHWTKYCLETRQLSGDSFLVGFVCVSKTQVSLDEEWVGWLSVVRGNDEIRCDNGNWCVRKCCPQQKVFVDEQCVTVSSILPDIFRAPFLPNHSYVSIPAVPRKLCLDEITKSVRYHASMLSFWDNGSIYLEDVKVECGYKDFCLEFFIEDLNERVTLQDIEVIACFSKEEKGIAKMTIYYGMIISMPFLLVTFVVYALLPDRNLHQKALMFYVLTLLIAYILLVTVNLSSSFKQPWCSVIAYVTIFSFMSSFFWMNVICFDIWYTFSGGRGFVGSKRSTERRRLIYYSLYALGGPLLILGLIGLMQTVLPHGSYHNPNIGVSKCFLQDGWANLWYFYLEAGILVLINVIFFTFTALKIRKVKKETSMLKHNDSKRHSYEKDKQKFNLYVKLLFAMGVNWSMEVISWAVNWRTDSNVQYIWYATDFFNAVYGVFIFFIFVFKKKIWTLLQKRYYNFIGKPHLAHTVISNQTRTSHYSSTNYSTADTQLTGTNGRSPPEEMGLRTLP